MLGMEPTWLTGLLAAEAATQERSQRSALDALQKDPRLLDWITLKLLNHLRWKGVDVSPVAPTYPSLADVLAEENRPVSLGADAAIQPRAVFEFATRYCSRDEIAGCVDMWLNQDRFSFLVGTLENQGASLAQTTSALEQFYELGIDDGDLPQSLQTMVRVALLRRFFTDEIEFINTAKAVVSARDFYGLTRRLLYPPGSHGKLGGKSAGLFLAQRIIEESPEYEDVLRDVRVPRTWYIASDGVLSFIRYNHLQDVYDRKYMPIEEVRQQYPAVVQIFKMAPFPPELVKGLARVLDDLGERPLIVRSSSLLEDRTGAAFSGKYKSLFLANLGTREERLHALQSAVAEVYASIFGPDPIEYRAERNLLDVHEEMGIMIQEVVGRRVGRYFLPAFAGVAFSNNEFRWSPRISREDGLIRLVPGLGTRAVDRIGGDYTIMFAPGKPGLRANSSVDEMVRYAPRMVDLINLETRSFETVPVQQLLAECGAQLPMVRRVVSFHDHGHIRRPTQLDTDFAGGDAIVTFEGLASDTPFIPQLATLLRVLQTRLGGPVDVEFASDGAHLYLLQCRPQCYTTGSLPATIPQDIPPERMLFTADRFISNGRVPDLAWIVYVDPDGYAALPQESLLRDVGRAVGRLNRVLPRRSFALAGPGRWGSRGDVHMGVSVTYSDINNTAVLIEVARRRGSYLPDLSFGTHFFQDLVEAEIRYLPLYPDEPGCFFNHTFFARAQNRLAALVPEFAHLSSALKVIDVRAETGGALRILMNGDLNEAVGYTTP